MSTYNFTDGSISGVQKPHNTTPRGFEPFILRNILDTSKQNLAADDIAQVINVPAGTIVLYCEVRMITVDGGGTYDVGITGVNVDQWVDGADATAATQLATPIMTAPYYFASADTIDVVALGATMDTLKLEIIAVCLDSSSTIDSGD